MGWDCSAGYISCGAVYIPGEGGGGVLSYSLGGDVPLGSQKSYPLLKSISQIL